MRPRQRAASARLSVGESSLAQEVAREHLPNGWSQQFVPRFEPRVDALVTVHGPHAAPRQVVELAPVHRVLDVTLLERLPQLAVEALCEVVVDAVGLDYTCPREPGKSERRLRALDETNSECARERARGPMHVEDESQGAGRVFGGYSDGRAPDLAAYLGGREDFGMRAERSHDLLVAILELAADDFG